MTGTTIALDAMGGDQGVGVVVPAACQALANNPHLRLILVGDKIAIEQQLQKEKSYSDRLTIHHASQVVTMEELPSHALRTKKDSSMRVAINLVKEGEAQACVSAGNTGALMATARFVLKTLPGIDRPAIISELPGIAAKVRMLDLGGNVDSCAEHLFQFAVMGAVLTSAIDKKARPTVGLLNIGTEEIKGNDQVKRSAHLLAECDAINYVGFIEGDVIFSGAVDVVVCDGFVGNVALKTSEGVAKLILHTLKKSFTQNWYNRVIGLLAKPILMQARKQIDPGSYNGASFIGLNNIVIKSHGGADIAAFKNAIDEAVREVEMNVPQLIHDEVARILHEGVAE